MKILNLGLDASVLDADSPLARRMAEYGELVEKYTALVPDRDKRSARLSQKAAVWGVGGKNKIAQFFNFYIETAKILRAEKYDVLTVQDPYYLSIIGLILSKKFKIGLEIQVHGFEKYGGLRKIVAKFVLPRAGAIRCVSERLKWKLISEFKVGKEKISVIPIFVETAGANQPLSWENKNPGKFVFLAASRLVPIKNIVLQIEAMARIAKKHPEAELWIAGDGLERENLELAASRMKIAGQVKFLGWQSDMRDLYAKADAFLLTSDAEGWPLVIIEAAANGLPIIMTNVGSADEFIKNWKNGIIIDPKDLAALEKAMADLIENEDFRRRLGAGAKQSALELPSKKQILDLYVAGWENARKK